MRGLTGAGESGYAGVIRNAKMEGVMVNIAGSSWRGGMIGAVAVSRYVRG